MQTSVRKARRTKARGAKRALRRPTKASRPGAKGPSGVTGRSGRLRGMTEADFAIPPSLARPKVVFLNCHYCGYAPEKMPKDEVCPKCGGHSWERFSLSAKLVPKEKK